MIAMGSEENEPQINADEYRLIEWVSASTCGLGILFAPVPEDAPPPRNRTRMTRIGRIFMDEDNKKEGERNGK